MAQSAAAEVNQLRISDCRLRIEERLLGRACGLMTYQLYQYKDTTALARDAAGRWLEQLRARTGKTGGAPCTVALSGGRITTTFFDAIVGQSGPGGPGDLFENVHFFWADERCVPPTDPESNFALAQEHLFGPLKIPDTQIHRLRGEAPEALALKIAVSEICGLAPMSNGQPVLDMIFLGMGENGHTASLFPEETEEQKNNPAIYRAVTTVKPPPRRITLGYAAIAAAREVCVLISGAGKEEALKMSLPPDSSTPLGRVLTMRKQTTIYTDVVLGLVK
jgi:6-phosphogluconolactonase